ncbi:YaaC family protein [Numidum massiliense]|uniref:YaaC family protein n=1 Tax=Numidum massiliense TaxID=1522315 RepID=UPI0006D554FA|nr:YaaC family protein [Numidum massiliense]
MTRSNRYVFAEQPEQKMWDTLLFLEGETAARQLLEHRYSTREINDASRLAFQNSAPFIYYLKQARAYFLTAQSASLLVKPPLLYYGMMGLTKAYVLTLDPFYPNQTSLLKHGMTTRKLKKRAYDLLADSVKVQKEGLLPHVLRLLGLRQALEEKFELHHLFGQLPHLYDVCAQVACPSYLEPLVVEGVPSTRESGSSNENSGTSSRHGTSILVQQTVLDHFHLSAASFVHLLNRHHTTLEGGQFQLQVGEEAVREGRAQCASRGSYVSLVWYHPHVSHVSESGSGFQNDLIVGDSSSRFFLRLLTERKFHLPEFSYYLLLVFHLGMLARYEPERWGEIVLGFGSDELYVVHAIVQAAEQHFPNLLVSELLQERFVFRHM